MSDKQKTPRNIDKKFNVIHSLKQFTSSNSHLSVTQSAPVFSSSENVEVKEQVHCKRLDRFNTQLLNKRERKPFEIPSIMYDDFEEEKASEEMFNEEEELFDLMNYFDTVDDQVLGVWNELDFEEVSPMSYDIAISAKSNITDQGITYSSVIGDLYLSSY